MKFNILDLLLPRETKFFDQLDQLAGYVLDSCVTLHDLVAQIETLPKADQKKRLYAIKDLEQKGDQLEMVIIEELVRCFITPLDREDIHTLAVNLEKPLNILKDLASNIEIYRLRKLPVEVCRFTEIIVSAAKLQQEIVHDLRTKQLVRRKVERIHKLENQADELYMNSMAELFRRSETALTVETLKLKDVYEQLEEVIDCIEEVAKLVRGIKIKHG